MIDADAPPPLLDGAALFLDFDGTLVELAESPQAINVSEHLGPLLDRLSARLAGRLAIVSGRSLADLDRHLSLSGIAAAGSHGLELRLPDGRSVAGAVPGALAEARAEIIRFAADAPGLIAEEKPYSIALHYRQSPAREAAVLALAGSLAARTGLVVQSGKMVVELRPAGADKGDTVRTLMAEPVFAGARPIFVGDDLTDENAFAAAAAMGGGGVLVGPARETAAQWRLADVRAVGNWLTRVAAS